jgi:hypothetical protein
MVDLRFRGYRAAVMRGALANVDLKWRRRRPEARITTAFTL